jgi:glycosyltransferase involved in cell wall biosynthesis
VASISVIIPAYNRASLLPQTLRSLLAQTLHACEILVVDDGSTDDTAAVAQAFGPPVRVIRQANAGPAAARNRGLREAVGEFLHFFDSDDLALPNKHEVQFGALERSGADIAYGPWVKGRIGETSFQPENLVLQQQGLPQGNLVRALLADWSVVPHACLFRRSIVEKVGGFPAELFGTEDQLMFLRCLLAGAKVVHSPGTLELYRTNDPGKITATGMASKARHFREWARFLVLARQECLEQQIDPSVWFGFRQRVWRAWRDLQSIQSSDTELLQQLEAMLSGRGPHAAYALGEWLGAKQGGLQRRLSGGRAHRSFRIGRITDEQQNLIAEMGLELQ